MNQTQPRSIRRLYGTALAVQTFDSGVFLLADLARHFIQIHSPEGSATFRLWKRVVQGLLFHITMGCWYARDYHIRHSIGGRVVGIVFASSSVLSAWYHVKDTMRDGSLEELFWPLVYLVGWRVVWAAWGLLFAA